MSAPLRRRLTALAVLVALVAIAALTVAFNIVLDAQSRLRRPRPAALARGGGPHHRVGHGRPVAGPRGARGCGARPARVDLRRASAPSSVRRRRADVQRAAAALAGRANVFDDLAGRKFRLYADPIRAGGRQVGTVVVGESLAAYDRTTDVALLGSVRAGGGAAGGGRHATVGRGRPRPRPGHADDAHGRRLERARHRQALRLAPRARTSSASWRARSTSCSTVWRRACATSSACQRSCRMSFVPRSPGSSPRPSCFNAASARRTSARRPGLDRPHRRSDEPDPRDADGGCPRGRRARPGPGAPGPRARARGCRVEAPAGGA